MHITCRSLTKEQIDKALEEVKNKNKNFNFNI